MADNSFGKVNKFNIEENTGYFQAIGLAYKKQIGADSGIFGKAWAGVKSPVYGTANYACHHPYKIAVVVGVVVAVPLMAAYFLSPAYAGFVNTTASSTYAGMIAGGKGLYALAVANPVFTGLLTAAIVFTVCALIYTNCNKASQIKEQASQITEVEKVIRDASKKTDNGQLEVKNGKLEANDGIDASTLLNNIAAPLKLVPEAKQPC